MSLNMVFWSIVITVICVAIFASCIKEMKKRGFKPEDKSTLAVLTFFYLAVMASIWIVFPEGWF